MFSSDKNFWETPQKLFDELDAEFHFTLDAAASDENHKCARYFTQNDDGLRQNWGGETVFCNPPYGSKETGLWTEKCCREGQKPGTTVVLLIPARTDRASFHDYVLGKAEIRFLRGRLKFELDGKPMGTAPFPSMIAIFRRRNDMTRDEIVTALRCCAEGECHGCTIHNDRQRCQERVLDAAADLIENQQRHIEALMKANAGLRDTVLRRDAQIADMSDGLAQFAKAVAVNEEK